ncbi:MAG TPA: hypothetical protein VM782_21435 [Stellaceae bacterium]|nr:hypothetical protein [Stellaceae bacterium]
MVAAPVAIYGLFARNRRRGFIASVIALVLSVLAVLMSIFMWVMTLSIFLTGRFPDGTSVNYGDPILSFYEAIAIFQALVLLTCILGAVRQRAGRRRG